MKVIIAAALAGLATMPAGVKSSKTTTLLSMSWQLPFGNDSGRILGCANTEAMFTSYFEAPAYSTFAGIITHPSISSIDKTEVAVPTTKQVTICEEAPATKSAPGLSRSSYREGSEWPNKTSVSKTSTSLASDLAGGKWTRSTITTPAPDTASKSTTVATCSTAFGINGVGNNGCIVGYPVPCAMCTCNTANSTAHENLDSVLDNLEGSYTTLKIVYYTLMLLLMPLQIASVILQIIGRLRPQNHRQGVGQGHGAGQA
ncbi:hypothetical protein DOTSEDRAFT_72818 [Dothistroma septosporum NZE10]|uniref:Uncharacterized protein n=1 Tax=Dothistroma septosporum (strain NZE10 / CBS 128990) TaxID=675120 RepID=M2YPM4_DOTSN|nr:hypothetical protein DOTSEDRAFT_72818 [Dothistroma septosporum NZE10]